MPKRREMRVTMTVPRSECGKFGEKYRAADCFTARGR